MLDRAFAKYLNEQNEILTNQEMEFKSTPCGNCSCCKAFKAMASFKLESCDRPHIRDLGASKQTGGRSTGRITYTHPDGRRWLAISVEGHNGMLIYWKWFRVLDV
jgi:hypothetical protein